MRNILHRKKILMALDARRKKEDGITYQDKDNENSYMRLNLERLDHQWVVRWLDDVGLPQYKDRFLESRVDGRVLNLLTVDDVLIGLRISNHLHHLSIKRGIQVRSICISEADGIIHNTFYVIDILSNEFHPQIICRC